MSCTRCYDDEKVIKLVDGTWRAVYEYSEYDSDIELRSSPYYGYGTPDLFLGYVTEGNFLKTIEDAYGQHEHYLNLVSNPEYDTLLGEVETFAPLTWEEEYGMYLESLIEEEPLEDTFSITDQLLSKHKVWERKRKRSKDNRNTLCFHKSVWVYYWGKRHKDARATKVFTEEDYLIGLSEIPMEEWYYFLDQGYLNLKSKLAIVSN